VQKGPFITGSDITVYELNTDLTPTGKTYASQISDNSGRFGISNINLVSSRIAVKATGYYYNENTGSLSAAPLSLQAIGDIGTDSSLNVNMLTHLEKPRVEFLMQQGMSYAQAKQQAQTEVLSIFNITNTSLPFSETLNISQNDPGNTVLLAVSCLLQGFRSEAELTELLTNISYDIKNDGVLNDAALGSALINHASYIDTVAVRNNLVSRYNSLGISAAIPHFEPYIQNFISQTSFVVTESLISYPASGMYGQNLLNLSQTVYPANINLSLAAQLKPQTSVKIIIRRVSGGGMWLYTMSSGVNWTISPVDYESNSQILHLLCPE